MNAVEFRQKLVDYKTKHFQKPLAVILADKDYLDLEQDLQVGVSTKTDIFVLTELYGVKVMPESAVIRF